MTNCGQTLVGRNEGREYTFASINLSAVLSELQQIQTDGTEVCGMCVSHLFRTPSNPEKREIGIDPCSDRMGHHSDVPRLRRGDSAP